MTQWLDVYVKPPIHTGPSGPPPLMYAGPSVPRRFSEKDFVIYTYFDFAVSPVYWLSLVMALIDSNVSLNARPPYA